MASKWSKRFKNLGKNLGKVLRYGAPVAGAFFGGTTWAAVGSGIGATAGVALSGGNRKDKAKKFKRSLIYGGAVTGGTFALSYAAGTSASAPLLTTLKTLFGGKGETASPGSGEVQSVKGDAPIPPTPSLPSTTESGQETFSLGDLIEEALGGEVGDGATPPYFPEYPQGGGGGEGGGYPWAINYPTGPTGTQESDMESDGGDGGAMPTGLILAGVGVLAFLALKK